MPIKNPLISIIITNYNGEKYLKKCFDSLLTQTYAPLEIIFADDCSRDQSVEFTRKYYPQIKISVNAKNSGLAITSNAGAKLARGKYLLFYNNDTIALPDFIATMVAKAESNVKIGIVCPRQLPYPAASGNKAKQMLEDLGGGSDIYGYICTAADAGHIFYPDAAIFIRHDLFKKIQGFDPAFFLYGEDMDLCWRVHLLGYQIAKAPQAKFHHDSSCAEIQDNKIKTTYRRRYLVERQTINKLFKYYKAQTLFWILPKFFFYYTLEAFFFLIFRLDYKMFYAVYLKAIFWNIAEAKSTARNRRHIQSIRVKDDRYILNLMYKKYRKLEAAFKLGIPKLE